jgi:peptidoglycan/xylan/chitin deacetylase (PgdA/CDA1 family)
VKPSTNTSEDSRSARVPVLMYHHIGHSLAGPQGVLTVAREEFRRQVEWLLGSGRRTIAPDALIGEHGPPAGVLLTFDDGYHDLLDYALPLLREMQCTAVIFIPAKHIGGTNEWDAGQGYMPRRLMGQRDLEWCLDNGFHIGSHGYSHVPLSGLPAADLKVETRRSREMLEEITGRRIQHFCYPYGAHDAEARAAVAAEYRLAFGTDTSLVTASADPFALPRLPVFPGLRSFEFRSMVRTGRIPIRIRAQRLATHVRARRQSASPAE